MLKISFALLLSLLAINTSHAGGGVLVGNGGNIVRCSGRENFFSADYILSKAKHGDHTKLAEGANPFRRMAKLLNAKLPSMANSYSQFMDAFENHDNSSHYVWMVPRNGLEVLRDEMMELPYSCKNWNGPVEIRQVVIRNYSEASGRVIFKYDPEALELIRNNKLQLSFLLVHEWLWDFTKDITVNRKINYFLHSTQLDDLSAEEIQSKFKQYGLSTLN
jgi:hypothetical protein